MSRVAEPTATCHELQIWPLCVTCCRADRHMSRVAELTAMSRVAELTVTCHKLQSWPLRDTYGRVVRMPSLLPLCELELQWGIRLTARTTSNFSTLLNEFYILKCEHRSNFPSDFPASFSGSIYMYVCRVFFRCRLRFSICLNFNVQTSHDKNSSGREKINAFLLHLLELKNKTSCFLY